MSAYHEFKDSLNEVKLTKGKFGVLKGKYRDFNFLVVDDEEGYWGYVLDDEPKPQPFGRKDPIEFVYSNKKQAVNQAMKQIDRKY